MGDRSQRDSTKSSTLPRRFGMANRISKPSMALYKPPGVRASGDFSYMKIDANGLSGRTSVSPTESCNSSVSDDSGSVKLSKITKSTSHTHVHFGKMNTLPHYVKSADANLKNVGNLKRSKSFSTADQVYMAALSSDKDPLENNELIRKACIDPNRLSSRHLMEVVRIICNRAVENSKNAEPAAQLCVSIIEKENESTFVESLLNSCREWFNEKDKLLRGTLSVAGVSGSAQRWIAYVTFLSELYLDLKDRLSNGRDVNNHNAVMLTTTLLTLLYECCQIIMKPPSIHNTEEVECMYSVLTICGRCLDSDCPQRMKALVISMRDAYVNPSITLNPSVRKLLLELTELHASRWQFDMPQNMYYFPYTRY